MEKQWERQEEKRVVKEKETMCRRFDGRAVAAGIEKLIK